MRRWRAGSHGLGPRQFSRVIPSPPQLLKTAAQCAVPSIIYVCLRAGSGCEVGPLRREVGEVRAMHARRPRLPDRQTQVCSYISSIHHNTHRLTHHLCSSAHPLRLFPSIRVSEGHITGQRALIERLRMCVDRTTQNVR
ncbi:hypothetical protein EJ02DRAFT_33790 [Clathrospora elynae]|uniref:Uncharacterized protein n=1 Tax=Clathrospora elynae TaxID=706981 RepID=A0A6A5T0S0_9PLEO|nr:hypothetical protein EJ02DRAFT_33790 [Clathrospora elynae]